MTDGKDFKARFDALAAALYAELTAGEHASVTFAGEHSFFMRFSGGKVRQSGAVEQARLSVKLCKGAKTFSFGLQVGDDEGADIERLAASLGSARATLSLLPDDPYQTVPDAKDVSDSRFEGRLLDEAAVPERVLKPAAGLDFVGIYSHGAICRGAANSAGARHWFSTETFLVDYSAYLPSGKAAKSSYAGREWNDADYAAKLEDTKRTLEHLGKPEKILAPGEYRVYITPDALSEVVVFFSWDGFGERGIRQGESAYLALREGRESFAPGFDLNQDFSLGVEPAFNSDGETAPALLKVVEKGKLVNTLVSSRTAKQYGIPSNAATEDEGMRSCSMGAGSLAESGILAKLGTGIYVSNFHYLNWSDPENARVTGMTRFACLWVEDGKIVAPIKDMRFDESLYNIFGSKLEAVTEKRSLLVDNMTYDARSVGGSLLPGIIVNGLKFTL